jgi:hypothetical protein
MTLGEDFIFFVCGAIFCFGLGSAAFFPVCSNVAQSWEALLM